MQHWYIPTYLYCSKNIYYYVLLHCFTWIQYVVIYSNSKKNIQLKYSKYDLFIIYSTYGHLLLILFTFACKKVKAHYNLVL